MEKLRFLSKELNLRALVLFTSVFIFISCEEVIEINLNGAKPILVAEGKLVKDSTAWIKLNYTTDYFANEKPIPEKNAVIVLTDENNNSETLIYFEEGIYKGSILFGEVGETYTLDITTDKGQYSATSTLMSPSKIYEILVSISDVQRPGQTDTAYSLEVNFRDVSTAKDFYMMKFFVNGEFDSYALVDDEIFIIGDTIKYPVIRKSFYKNDEVIVRLHSVDYDTFNYYNQLNDVLSDGMGPGGSSTPYNPASNFGANVMGYFTAWSYVSETIKIR